MAVALTKHPIGPTTIVEILTACDIAPPSFECMRRTGNKAADAFIGLNQKQLGENRKVIKDIKLSMGCANGEVSVSLDGSYNNCSRGSNYNVGTQCYSPMFCSDGGLNRIPVGVATCSKFSPTIGLVVN